MFERKILSSDVEYGRNQDKEMKVASTQYPINTRRCAIHDWIRIIHHDAYLVDYFMDNNAMVKDWECMTDLLLEEPGPNAEVLDNKQESTLIEIMVSAVKQLATARRL